ncbi:tyrosine-type recombinase/integrase [Saccharopolyspora shandongensis]|uniref:tyrosine-type recombinase/integrase n=1 Tax=Saccharopolyspora shandongensis TaxID=418495 RepID=UPI000B84861B|nr:tyrosine-type recombinase/integrase [Saccharopolyspora shandongensis]
MACTPDPSSGRTEPRREEITSNPSTGIANARPGRLQAVRGRAAARTSENSRAASTQVSSDLDAPPAGPGFSTIALNSDLTCIFRLRIHDCRHVAATLILAGGADMKVVQALLGHASLSVTADLYASVLPELALAAAEAAAALVPRSRRPTAGLASVSLTA